MLFKNPFILTWMIFGICVELLGAKSMVDCRISIGEMSECDPYSSRLLKTKEVFDIRDEKALVRVKRLAKPEAKLSLRVVPAKEMLDSYLKREKSIYSQEEISPSNTKNIIKDGMQTPYGIYRIVAGDSLNQLSKVFGVTKKKLASLNHIDPNAILHIGQKIKLPYKQEMVDLFRVAYEEKKVQRQQAKIAIEQKEQKFNLLQTFGEHQLRVTATAYTSHIEQTDETPFVGAWNNHLTPGMKAIAVSRDLLALYGLKNGMKVRIDGLPGFYTILDKMNKRYRKRIDVYMGIDIQKALHWGRRSVMIYW
jgi:3D (Asp-Asp-Asp) domain-containing protein